MKIDAHQHFWTYDPVQYGWIGEGMEVLARDFGPEHLQAELEGAALDGAITVQARQDLDETRWMLDMAREHPFLRGVVGWVDLCSTEAAAQLEELGADPGLVGIRHVLQDEPDDRFMLREDFQRGLAAMAGTGLVYDLLIFPRHLTHAIELVDRFPEQAFVLDHLAKPPIAEGALEPWRASLAQLAEREHVTCKLSGMVTEADWARWRPEDIAPFMDAALESFGPKRLMFGSDWPVCTLAAPYQAVHAVAMDWASKLSDDERASLFGECATRVYLKHCS
jgi:L-fuconolactonase